MTKRIKHLSERVWWLAELPSVIDGLEFPDRLWGRRCLIVLPGYPFEPSRIGSKEKMRLGGRTWTNSISDRVPCKNSNIKRYDNHIYRTDVSAALEGEGRQDTLRPGMLRYLISVASDGVLGDTRTEFGS